METVYTKSAIKGLAAVPQKRAKDILDIVRRVAAEPGFQHNELKPLKGVPNGYRLRSGDWRISFILDQKAGRLEVFEVAPRGKAYR